MAKLPILVAPDPRLAKKSEPVAEVNGEIRQLMDDMLETMYAAPGIGLAAPQVGALKRVIVLDVAGEDEAPAPLRMANPEIVWVSDDDAEYNEGCLSVPEQYADVTRPAEVTVDWQDEDGKPHRERMTGLMATCIQHEHDHLEGICRIEQRGNG